jgi:hypothetical protein
MRLMIDRDSTMSRDSTMKLPESPDEVYIGRGREKRGTSGFYDD